MSELVRQHPRIAAGLMSIVSLALVFGAALGLIPADQLPRMSATVLDAIPPINAIISVIAILVIGTGWRAIRRGHVRRHRALMLAGFGLFVVFLVLYLYKVSLEGPTAFPGPRATKQLVYLPLLVGHIGLAIITLPLLYYVLVLGLTRSPAAIARSLHPRVGRIAAGFWISSFAFGIVVYLMLYVLY